MAESEFKDLFSTKSSEYARYRPHYPQELYQYLSSICTERNTAWDVATGNGQVAYDLADHFYKVIATDPSEKQLSNAKLKKIYFIKNLQLKNLI